LSAAKKLTRTKIRALSQAGKALLAENVFERVCREARGTFSFYFESALAGKVATLASSVLFLSSVAVRLFGRIFQSEQTTCAVTTDIISSFKTSQTRNQIRNRVISLTHDEISQHF